MLCAVKAKAVACEIDAVGIVDEAVENGVGVSRITDNIVPFVDWELAGDDCRSSPVAFFEDFEEIMPCSGIERFEAPVIKDEGCRAPKRPHQGGCGRAISKEEQSDVCLQPACSGVASRQGGRDAHHDDSRGS